MPHVDQERPQGLGASEPLTIAEAARAAAVSERVLRKRVARGTVASTRVERNGQLVAAVEVAELLRHYPDANVAGSAPGPDPSEPLEPPGSDPGRTRPDPRAASAPEPGSPSSSSTMGDRPPSTALVVAVSIPVDVLSELRSRADRTALAERALEEERQERRATLRALVQSQERIRAILEAPDAPPARADRPIVYAVAAVALVGIAALGWRLHTTDAQASAVAAERDAAVGEVSRAAGEASALRETLKGERRRVEELAREVERTERERLETIEQARAAVAFDVVLQAILTRRSDAYRRWR